MGENVSLTCKDGKKIGAYVAKPAGAAKGAVVVLQEIFGANQHIRKTADLYASSGYLAIAPALYDRVEPNVELGYTGDDPKKGMEIRGKTELPKTLLDIEAAIDHVKSAGKVGVVGYCWGGTLTFAAACKLPGRRGLLRLLRRRHRHDGRPETDRADHHAFRRKRPRHLPERCGKDQGGVSGCSRLCLSWRRPRLQTATSAPVSRRKRLTSPARARWTSSPSICNRHRKRRGS